jgi:hypothetical protein
MADVLCKLSLEQLNALSGRLDEMSETARNPGYRSELQAARFAVQDLSSARFAITEITDKISKFADDIETKVDGKIRADIIEFTAELLELIGQSEQ